ncbi:hypothetical protein LZ30DRAFT_704187 [Colletotrichum cereale]|nr:hypothetical protein LZ30DRAFT_704187 [Colletotrichum cereale]
MKEMGCAIPVAGTAVVGDPVCNAPHHTRQDITDILHIMYPHEHIGLNVLLSPPSPALAVFASIIHRPCPSSPAIEPLDLHVSIIIEHWAVCLRIVGFDVSSSFLSFSLLVMVPSTRKRLFTPYRYTYEGGSCVVRPDHRTLCVWCHSFFSPGHVPILGA